MFFNVFYFKRRFGRVSSFHFQALTWTEETRLKHRLK